MNPIRPTAVAGTFYDSDPARLTLALRSFLQTPSSSRRAPKAVVAPHAGYIYSGPVAGSIYSELTGLRGQVDQVVLLGPAHHIYIEGVAASTAEFFATPLGNVPVDQARVRALVEGFDFIEFSDAVHAPEHSLEVQLPFLQEVLGRFTLLPFAVGHADPADVEALLNELWGGEETIVVVSSDLSHFRNYDAARKIDEFTSERIRSLDCTGLTGEHACGNIPIQGLLRVAARREMYCNIIDLRNSGDTAGPRDRVVGYGAFAFYPS